MSGMIYAVIVVVWAAFLVPMWLRRHDESAEARSVDKFASKMRVLARRTGETRPAAPAAVSSATPGTVSSTVRIVGPAPVVRADAPALTGPPRLPSGVPTYPATARRRALREQWADDEDDAALAALAAPDLARDLARDKGYGRAPATIAARRRRVLVGLVALTLVVVGLTVLSVLPWLAAAVSGALLAAYVVHLRVQAKRTAEIVRRRRRATRHGAVAARPARPARSLAAATAELAVPDRMAAVDDDPDAWAPVSVPVPTYVTAPRIGRPVRRIDLRSADAWTSGRLVADAAAAGRAAAAAAHEEARAAEAEHIEESAVPRAVGD